MDVNTGVPKISALASWYGSNRLLSPVVAEHLSGCDWVGIPFGGGLSELAHLRARTVLVSDLHRHIINLANVVKNDELRKRLIEDLDATPFHPDVLRSAQECCIREEEDEDLHVKCDLEWARAYFICSWMGRSGKSGTDDEFSGKVPARWNAGGGDSAVRFRSATDSLIEWGGIMRRCTFVCMDVFDFLLKVKDAIRHGLYLDPPFPKEGHKYAFNPGKDKRGIRGWHARLASQLTSFRHVRVVVRMYEHPLVRELYLEKDGWIYNQLKGRKSSNVEAAELLIVRN